MAGASLSLVRLGDLRGAAAEVAVRVPSGTLVRRRQVRQGAWIRITCCDDSGVWAGTAAVTAVTSADLAAYTSIVLASIRVSSASVKPRLAGRQPSAAVGCPG
jgi:hypothetical protein